MLKYPTWSDGRYTLQCSRSASPYDFIQQVSIGIHFTAGQHRFHSAGQQRNTSDSRSASLCYTAGQQRNTKKGHMKSQLNRREGKNAGAIWPQ